MCLATLDVKDAFLQGDQPSPMLVVLLGQQFTVKKNLPGQRLGAKSWYWFLRDWVDKEMSMTWCPEQPCLAKNEKCCLIIHVDDILYCGSKAYWNDVFLAKFKQRFKVSFSQLEGIGSEISFLKRRIRQAPRRWFSCLRRTSVQCALR